MENQQVQYASFWIRFLAFIVDVVIIVLLQLVLLLPLIFFIEFKFTHEEIMNLNQDAMVTLVFGFYITLMVIAWLYFALLHASSRHATAGKMLLGIKVCHAHGRDLSFSRTSLRYVSKYISFGILFIGFIIAAFTPHRQALHDFIADTIVIKK